MPRLSSLGSEKISNDTKYRESTIVLLSVIALSNKFADLLRVNSELKDIQVISRRMKEAATV